MSNGSATPDWQWKNDLQLAIWSAVPPFAIPFGVASNLCAFTVLLQPRLRTLVVHLPLTVLSVVDSVVLLFGLMRHWLRKAPYFVEKFGNSLDPQTLCSFCCKFFELLLYLSLMYSSWIIMIIAIERFLAICVSPGSRARACLISRKGLAATLVAVFVFLLGVNLHFLVTRDLRSQGEEVVCTNLETHKFFVERMFPRIDLVLTAFIPFVVIAVCNCMIINTLRRVRRSSMLTGSKIGSYRTTMMLLLITFMFMALTSPVKLYLTIVGGAYPNAISLQSNPDAFYTYRIVWSCLLVLQFSNHCCNFLLYCASNPLFRKEAIRLFTQLCCCTCTLKRATSQPDCCQQVSTEVETQL